MNSYKPHNRFHGKSVMHKLWKETKIHSLKDFSVKSIVTESYFHEFLISTLIVEKSSKHSVIVWKNDKFNVTKEKFRQSNWLVFSLVKTLFSRNFCPKNVTVNFRNFHTVNFRYWTPLHCGE